MSGAAGGGDGVVVWRFTDGRAGHENQTLGLVRGLARRLRLESHDLRVHPGRLRDLTDWALGRTRYGAGLPDPHLLVGAGHRTHLPLLCARRARGGRTVVVMRPSLPLRCFDLCLIPVHDRAAGPNVVTTRGALNAVEPAAARDPDTGLVLLGGPSRHCRWPEASVCEQVHAVVARHGALRWTVAGSPRTPASTLDALRGTLPPGTRVLAFADTAPGWLAGRLGRAGAVWVSEDSVSMVYEALSGGAATGLVELPCRPGSRVHRGLDALVDEGWVTRFSAWRRSGGLAPPPRPLAEADRCAAWIAEHWLSGA